MTKIVKRQESIFHTFKGFKFEQRASDGFVDVTALCQANGKLFADYIRSKTKKKFVEGLASVMGIPITELIQSVQGGIAKNQGTFAHPLIANNVATWCSVECAIFGSVLIETWKQGRLQYSPKQKHTLTEAEKEAQREATLTTKELSDVIKSRLNQEPDRIYQHVEDTIHAVPTNMTAGYHKKQVGADNGMKILSNTEKDIYKTTKRMVMDELLKYSEYSLSRREIREIAKQVSDKCRAITAIHEQIGSLDGGRYIAILPQSKKNKINLLK
jgi:hypothetical protein